MKLCGLTGGIGMGKSTAAGLLAARGVRVVDTDEIAREIVESGQPALAEIASVFGNHLLGADGSLQRDLLAKVVFSDPVSRKKLETILHPRIRERWKSQICAWKEEGTPVAVVVIPLLFETQAESEFDKIVCVACSETLQRRRLAARGWDAEHCEQRNAAQMPVEQKIAKSHYVIWTEGDLDSHSAQIDRILAKL